jgi:ubiquinone/menaquinone biosynthesis C-methylase UbiE
MVEMPMSTIGTNKPKGTGGFLDPERILERFGVTEGMIISDFGSGAGYFTTYLAEKVGPDGKVHALDILESSLDSVRVKANALGLKNIEITRTNLEVVGSSGLPSGSQDMVLMANILFQSHKKDQIFQEAKRVLKVGGKIIMIDWEKGSGGFGPPNDLRLESKSAKSLAEKEGFTFQDELDAGKFHFGMIFIKK